MYLPIRSKGFTLIELMITVALVAIVAAIAVPSFSTMIANSRIATTSNDLVGLINHARAEAVKRGRVVTVSPLDGSDWANGVVAWIDQNSNGSFDSSEAIRVMAAAPGSVTISATQTFGFSGGGSRVPTGASEVEITVCDDRVGATGREIKVQLGGRVRAGDEVCN